MPPYWRITSLGRCALPLGMFSAMHAMPVTLIGSLRSATARTVAKTAAAPPMSAFMVCIDAFGLIEMPPVSNVMPLPTSTT